MCAVACRLCAFVLCLVLCGTQLVFFIGCMLSCCHVLCEHVAYDYSVLHMAGDLCCCPCACVFVLYGHVAFVLVFSVPCALMSIVLTPPILLPDYWLFFPHLCFPRYLLICSLYNLLVFAALCQFAVKCF